MKIDSQQEIIIRAPDPAVLRQWARFRGWTISILEELQHSGGLTIAQIADKLNHRRVDVKEYCRRLYRSGCIEQIDRWGYKITTQGLQLLQLQPGNTKATTRQHLGNTKATLRQLTLAPYSDSEYSEPELAVTNLLISHYNKTGQPFIFIEDEAEICELVGLPPDVLGATLRKLYQDRVCYFYNNRKYGRLQLRLYEDFLERIKHV